MSAANSFPEPSQWSPATTTEAMKTYKFNDTVFQNMEKEQLASKLLENLHRNGNNWEAAVPKSNVIAGQSAFWNEAMESLIKDGYVSEAEGNLYATEKLKDVLVHTTHERATGIPGKMAELEKAAREAIRQPKASVAAKAEAVAAKDGRAWYKFATHSVEDGKAVFSTPRTAISGAILLGTGLAAHHFLKSGKPENWQDRAQPSGDATAIQR